MSVIKTFRLVFGTLYPAYASYKAVRTKNIKEYVKWMMYWIVFALFTCTETFTDIFLSWFPFYYEIKIILVIWLLSPATKGSSILYRKFVHPMLSSREQEIDDYISKAKEQSYRQVIDLGQKGVTVLMQTAIKSGGGIVNQLKKSYSLGDLSDPSNGNDEADDVLVNDPRLIKRRKPGRSPHRSSSASSASVYFSEVDVAAVGLGGAARTSEVRSAEDISSGYSSGECLYAAHQPLKLQSRESITSQRTSSLTRSRSTRVTRSSVPKKTTGGGASDDSDENEVFDTNIIFLNDKVQKIDRLAENKHESSSSETEFFDIPDNNNLHGSKHVQSTKNKNPACSSGLSLSQLRSNLTTALSSLYPNFVPEKGSKPIESSPSVAEPISGERGGKYHKRHAPLPPLPPRNATSSTVGPIKATLVLQPGVVRNLSCSAESLNKEIFLNYSPKMRRRSKNQSSNDTNHKGGGALSKMLRQLNIPGRVKEKRHSWGEFFHTRKLDNSKVQSKSTGNLDTIEEGVGEKATVATLSLGGSQVSVRSLSNSPLAHRRLRIIRKYVDNDID